MKYKRIILAILLVTLPIAGQFVVPATEVSAAPSHKECYDKYDGTSYVAGSREYREFMDSGCDAPNVCSTKSVDATMYTVECTNPDNPDDPCDPSSPTYVDGACDPFLGGNPGSEECADAGDCAKHTSLNWCGRNTKVGITCLVNEILTFLSVGVGIAVVAGVIFGGITYSTSQGNPAQVQKGITIIANSAIGLVLYLLMWAIIQWLIPGGVF